jgi:hypothetical protein
VDEDGMVILRVRLTPEQGAVVQRAREAASDRLYQESRHATPAESVEEEVTSAQRRADALVLLAECALHDDLDRGSTAGRYQVVCMSTPARRWHRVKGRRCWSWRTVASAFPRKRRGASRARPR